MKRTIFAALAALLLLPAVASAKDRNHDSLPDSWERAHSLSLKLDQARRDQDADGVRNRAEFKHGLDPRDDDSDDDGTHDGEEAGAVKSFDAATGELVIALLDGSELSGKVTDDTEIECPASDDHSARASHDGDDDDDHSGPGHSGDDDDDDHGDGDHGDDDDDDHDHECSTDALVAGAKVHEAELDISSAGKVWDEIELI